MAPPLIRRLHAILLAVVFIGGGFGVPNADALLYHGGGPVDAAASHVERPGGCGAHAEHCVLALAASLRQLAGGIGAVPEPSHAPVRVSPIAPAAAPRAVDRVNLQPTRAPPPAS